MGFNRGTTEGIKTIGITVWFGTVAALSTLQSTKKTCAHSTKQGWMKPVFHQGLVQQVMYQDGHENQHRPKPYSTSHELFQV